jgi:hypothetical protein
VGIVELLGIKFNLGPPEEVVGVGTGGGGGIPGTLNSGCSKSVRGDDVSGSVGLG